MLDAIVLGLGVMGSAALHRLALAGQRVRGIERFDVPSAMGSSHGGTRVTRKAYFEDARYVPLLERSWQLVREMEAARNETLLVKTGGLYFGPAGSPSVQASYEAARTHGLEHEWLDASAIRSRFPMFSPEEGDAGVLESDAGVLLAEKVVTAQVELARAAGADVRTNERALRVELGAEGVRVTTDRGVHEADRLVMALGPWTPEGIEGLPSIAIPLRVERQVQLWLAPQNPSLFMPDRMPVFLRFGETTAFYGLPTAVYPGVKVCRHHGGVGATPDTLDRELRAEDEASVRAFVSPVHAARGRRRRGCARVHVHEHTGRALRGRRASVASARGRDGGVLGARIQVGTSDGRARGRDDHPRRDDARCVALRSRTRVVIGIGIVIERFVDAAQPGFVGFTLVDAAGRTWSFIDKVPAISMEDLSADTTYPRPGWIACEVVDRFVRDGRELAVIDTGSTWGISAVGGETRFEVLASEVRDRD